MGSMRFHSNLSKFFMELNDSLKEESRSKNIWDTSKEDRKEGLGLQDAKICSKAIVARIGRFA